MCLLEENNIVLAKSEKMKGRFSTVRRPEALGMKTDEAAHDWQ